MIREKTCFCGKYLRANGESAFNEMVKNHLFLAHPKLFRELKLRVKEANERLQKLQEEYKPIIYLAFSHFKVDLMKILENEDSNVEALNRLHNQLPENPLNMTSKDIENLEKKQDEILKR